MIRTRSNGRVVIGGWGKYQGDFVSILMVGEVFWGGDVIDRGSGKKVGYPLALTGGRV